LFIVNCLSVDLRLLHTDASTRSERTSCCPYIGVPQGSVLCPMLFVTADGLIFHRRNADDCPVYITTSTPVVTVKNQMFMTKTNFENRVSRRLETKTQVSIENHNCDQACQRLVSKSTTFDDLEGSLLQKNTCTMILLVYIFSHSICFWALIDCNGH